MLDEGSPTHEAQEIEETRETVEELRASRRRLVLADDENRRRIERALHEGVQQDLVALAVNLQLASADPAGAKELLDELARDVQRSLDETARLAQRIYSPRLDAAGLAAALRSVAVSLGVRASIEVSGGEELPPELVCAIYFCGVDLLERVGPDGRMTIAIRTEAGAHVFDVTTDPQVELESVRDRLGALGGRLASS